MNLEPYYFWFTAGIIVLVVEVFTLSVILLFIGLASITVGGLLFFGVIDYDSKAITAAVFLGSIFLWYLALYIPIKKIKMFKLKNNYKNIVDQKVQLLDELEKGKVGKVKWSGTIMKAVLSANNISSKIEKNEIARVVSVEENILTITNNNL